MRYFISKKTVTITAILFIALWLLAMISIFYNMKLTVELIDKRTKLEAIKEIIDSLKGQTQYQKSVIMDLEEDLIKSKEV